MKLLTRLLVALAALGIHATHAAPADLDPSYGANGLATFKLQPSTDVLTASTRQSNGSIVSIGRTFTGEVRRDIVLVRHLAGGTLDNAFGTAGRVVSQVPAANEGSSAWIGLQAPWEKLVVAVPCDTGVCVGRFNSDGALDTTFGNASGWAVVSSSDIAVVGMAIRPNGKIVFAGRGSSDTISVLQLDAQGTPDASFGSGGRSTVGLTQQSVNGIALQPDGKIVVSGDQAFVARFLANGGLDASFGLLGSGIAKADIASKSLALQPDGKFVLAACDKVARLDAIGDLDPSFGSGGYANLPGMPANCLAPRAEIQLDGRLAVSSIGGAGVHFASLTSAGGLDPAFGSAGYAQVSLAVMNAGEGSLLLGADGSMIRSLTAAANAGDLALARVLANGDADLAFGTDGIAAADSLSGHGGTMRAMRLMNDGRKVVLISKRYTQFTSDYGFLTVVRLLADGSPDPNFAPPTVSDVPLDASALDVRPDGKVVIGGEANGAGAVWRFNADGSLDSGFGTAGRYNLAAGPVTAVVAQPDGKVGLSATGSVIARLTDAGALDSTFASGAGMRTVQVAVDSNGITAIALQADGKWISGGVGNDSAGSHVIAARTLDGEYDAAWGTSGRVLGPVGGGSARRVLMRADGSAILVESHTYDSATSGYLCRPTGPHFDPLGNVVLTAIDANGAIDTTFSGGGQATWSAGVDTLVTGAALDAQGRIVLTGARREMNNLQGCTYSGYVARFTSQGVPDPLFGANGIRNMPASLLASQPLADIAVLPDGRILVAGNTADPAAPFATWKLIGGGPLTGPAGDRDADGIPDGVEASVGRNPDAKDNDIFGNAQLFAMQQYRDFLGREGDAGGIQSWTNSITSGGQNRSQVIESFFNSAEFQGTISPVARLYFAYFLRIPDYDGLNFWIGYYRSGNSLAAISDFFAGSAEFTSTYGSLDNSHFVDLVYNNVLGRPADAGGKAYWQGQLDTHAMSRGQVMLGFSESTEYKADSANPVYVTMMYVGMLRRAPDANGFAFWVDSMDHGNPGLGLIGGFLGSAEYHARFLP